MPYTKLVIREPYYDCPKWFENDVNRTEFLVLSAECTSSDVALFLVHLFGYTNTNVNQSMKDTFHELIERDSVAILGGVAFYETEDKFIMPSCCCGLEQFGDIYNSIIKRECPWLGHDPSPGITYKDNMANVWSDNPDSDDKSNIFSVDYKFEEILSSLEKSKNDLKQFIDGPLYEWIYQRDKEIAQRMKEKMYQWFLADILYGGGCNDAY